MTTCTAFGKIYAPTHPNRDAEDCIPHMILNPMTGVATFTSGISVDTGGASVTGSSILHDTLTVHGATTLNNSLNVTGASTFGSSMSINGRLTANELFVGSGNVGNIPTCSSSQKLHWNGAAWVCVTDNVGATAATEVDPKVGVLTNGRWCRTNGAQVICDVNVPVACPTSQKITWSGSAWSCIPDQGLTTETDPKVGVLSAGKWCTSNGSVINCTSDAPSGSGGGTAGCAGGSVTWGSNCGGSRPSVAHGAVVTVSSGCLCFCCPPNAGCGSHTFTCMNGVWLAGSSTCSQPVCSGGDDFGDW